MNSGRLLTAGSHWEEKARSRGGASETHLNRTTTFSVQFLMKPKEAAGRAQGLADFEELRR